MQGTIRHIHIPVERLLSMEEKEFAETVTHPDGMEAAKKDLEEMLAEGVTCLVLNSTCDNKNADGSCAGHSTKDDQSS